MKFLKAFFVGLLLLSATAQARPDWWPETLCQDYSFPTETSGFKMATVAGNPGTKVNFVKDSDGCPSANANCLQKAYLLPGDKILISRAYQGFTCAYFQPAKKGAKATAGWLPSAAIGSPIEEGPATIKQWVGAWTSKPNSLNLTATPDGAGLKVNGEALWFGNGDNVHTGNVAGAGKPIGRHLSINQDDFCLLQADLVGGYLVVSDNMGCGGANVTFNGVYQK